ncbi:MAG: hypothetical protein QXR81_08955 [Candidatus Nezhaarchaeales archaeon]
MSVTSVPVRFGSMNAAKVDVTFNPYEILQLRLAHPQKAIFLYAIVFGDVEPDAFRLTCLGNRDFDPFDVIIGEENVLFPWMIDYALVMPEDPLVFIATNLTASSQRFEASFVYAQEARERAAEIRRKRRTV